VVADVGVHRRAVALGDVGRIRYDRVEPLRKSLLQPVQGIGFAERDRCAELLEILRRHGQRVVRDVGGEDLRPGHPQSQRSRDAAAARPYVQQPPGFALPVQDRVDQLFGFGPRDQNPFAYGEAAAVKFRVSDDVLQRLARSQTGCGLFQPFDGEFRFRVGQQGRRRKPRKLRHGGQRDAAGFACVVKSREPCGQRVDAPAARHWRMKLARAMATAASMTTAPRRATQTSWRPWISSGSTLLVARL